MRSGVSCPGQGESGQTEALDLNDVDKIQTCGVIIKNMQNTPAMAQ